MRKPNVLLHWEKGSAVKNMSSYCRMRNIHPSSMNPLAHYEALTYTIIRSINTHFVWVDMDSMGGYVKRAELC